MTEKTRRCTRCGIVKHFDEYYSDDRGKWGKFAKCKSCCAEYRKRYRNTLKGKKQHRKDAQKARNMFPERVRAHNAVNNRIRQGKLLPPSEYQCSYCQVQATNYHHYSYSSENVLNVIPVCKKCHIRIHYEKQVG